jgi:branched-chain amino acid transport system substrate-binding protein
MLKAHDPAATQIAILHENASFATEVATAAQEYSQRQGLEVVMFEQYEAGTTDFGSWTEMLTSVEPDALLGGGHFADGTALAQALSEERVPVSLISLLVAPAVPDFAEIGSAALYVTGPSQWEPQVQYNTEGASALGISFYGLGVSEFTEDYTAEYGYQPGYHAAGGYASGLVLQHAMETAESTELEQVERTLEEMDVLTLFGRIKFDSGARHGLQIGHEMVYLQWQQDSGGQFVKEVIWPQSAASAPLLYPRLVP